MPRTLDKEIKRMGGGWERRVQVLKFNLFDLLIICPGGTLSLL